MDTLLSIGIIITYPRPVLKQFLDLNKSKQGDGSSANRGANRGTVLLFDNRIPSGFFYFKIIVKQKNRPPV